MVIAIIIIFYINLKAYTLYDFCIGFISICVAQYSIVLNSDDVRQFYLPAGKKLH